MTLEHRVLEKEADCWIRPYTAEDAPHLAELFFRSVRTLGLRRYSAEQVAVWAPGLPTPATVHRRATDGRLTLVAIDGSERRLAYGDLEPNGHIDQLFAHPRAAGLGTAGRVLDQLISHAVQWRLASLHTEASELACSLFAGRGFELRGRRDFERQGVAIHNYAMTLEIHHNDTGQEDE
jgi:putative acetyltransferase